jgi:trimethylamine--corrinoid protein Co-methyltransferase
LINRQVFENWEASGSKTYRDSVHERVMEILDAEEQPLLDEKMYKELRRVCELADEKHKSEELDYDMFSKKAG